jgi:hypothetical protein
LGALRVGGTFAFITFTPLLFELTVLNRVRWGDGPD